MKNWLIRCLVLFPAMLLHSCSMFTAVDPLPPAFSKLEIVDVKRSEITVSGAIQDPDSKNDRQQKKSGMILEYGLVYGTTPTLSIETSSVLKLGEKPNQTPVSIQNQKISGLLTDTQYYIALYARNEGGGIAYSEIVNIKTTVLPTVAVTRTSEKITTTNGTLAYDLDAGRVVTASDAKTDVSVSWFTISGRGTVVEIAPVGKIQFKNMGVAEYSKLTYLDLVRITDYTTATISYLINTQTTNNVIAFKTSEGRYGKWRIEAISGNDLTMSLIAYDN